MYEISMIDRFDNSFFSFSQKVITTYGREQSDMSDEIQKIINEGVSLEKEESSDLLA